MTDEVLKYILLAYVQVENLYGEYSKEQIAKMHSAYKVFLTRYPTFELAKFFIEAG